jgi:glycerol-3-phosphate dehydrogenase
MRADVVVIGGGMQGVTMAAAAAAKGLAPIIVERGELGSGATGHSYGIIHGGLRHLQTLDVARWKHSRRAQAWFLARYPRFVRPLPCIMPLYRGCLRSPIVFRAAMTIEDMLIGAFGMETPMPRARLTPAEEVAQAYDVPREGLAGAALWHDAQVDDMAGLIRAMLDEAGIEGAAVKTGTEALALKIEGGKVSGLGVRDRESGEAYEIATRYVINCAGSWSRGWRDDARVPTAHALAFNLLLDMPFPGDAALGFSEFPGRGRAYFLRPFEGGTLAGTYYRPAPGAGEPAVNASDIADFLAVIDRAMPGMGLARAKIRAVHAGLLPDRDGTGRELSPRDHVSAEGPAGYWTVLGGKLTTAPLLSFEAADRFWPASR